MVREFKIRRTPFKVWLGVIIVIVAIVLMALHTENYWNLMPIVLPVLLLIDEQMTRIQVQENGDIWLKRGFSGSIKAYGVRRIALRKKDSLLKGRITIKEIGIWDPRFSNLDSGIKNLIAFEVKIGKAKSEGIWITKSIIGEGHDSYSGKTIEKIAIDDTIDVIVEVDDYKGRIKYFLPVTDTINHHGIDVCRYWKTDNGKLTVISNVAIGKSPILIKK